MHTVTLPFKPYTMHSCVTLLEISEQRSFPAHNTDTNFFSYALDCKSFHLCLTTTPPRPNPLLQEAMAYQQHAAAQAALRPQPSKQQQQQLTPGQPPATDPAATAVAGTTPSGSDLDSAACGGSRRSLAVARVASELVRSATAPALALHPEDRWAFINLAAELLRP